MDRILVFDIGTGGIHVSAIGPDGSLVSGRYEQLDYDRCCKTGFEELNPGTLLNNCLRIASGVVASVLSEGDRIIAVSVTSQRHGAVFADEKGNELCAFPNVDPRASTQARRIASTHNDLIFSKTMRCAEAFYPSMRMIWLRENDPELFGKVHTFHMLNDWLVFKLTGRACIEWTNAAETLMFDVRKKSWSDELQELFGLKDLTLSELVPPGTIAGYLKDELRSSLRLPESVPVVLSLSDTQSALLGAGTLDPGDITVVSGSTTPVQQVLVHPVADQMRRVITGPYVCNKWVLEANCRKTGIVHRSITNGLSSMIASFCQGESVSTEVIDRFTLEMGLKYQPVLGFFGPVVSNVSRTTANRLGIVFEGEEPDIFSAILPAFVENMAFSAIANIELLEEVSGANAGRIRFTGGSARNSYLRHVIMAASKGNRIFMTETAETTSNGAALIAYHALGHFNTLEESAENVSARSAPLEVDLRDPDRHYYSEKYERWLDTYQRLNSENLAVRIQKNGGNQIE